MPCHRQSDVSLLILVLFTVTKACVITTTTHPNPIWLLWYLHFILLFSFLLSKPSISIGTMEKIKCVFYIFWKLKFNSNSKMPSINNWNVQFNYPENWLKKEKKIKKEILVNWTMELNNSRILLNAIVSTLVSQFEKRMDRQMKINSK